MSCEYCMKIGGKHDSRCPNSVLPKSNHYCSICGEGIYDGEEYIENDKGDCRHYECFYGMRELLEWLGYEIKTMDDYDEPY